MSNQFVVPAINRDTGLGVMCFEDAVELGIAVPGYIRISYPAARELVRNLVPEIQRHMHGDWSFGIDFSSKPKKSPIVQRYNEIFDELTDGLAPGTETSNVAIALLKIERGSE